MSMSMRVSVAGSVFKCSARSARLRQRARRQEVVHERQRRLQPARQRRVVEGADQRVEPDQAMAAPLQARDLLAQHDRIAAVPAVGDEQHDRAAVRARGAPTAGGTAAAPRRCACRRTSRAPPATTVGHRLVEPAARAAALVTRVSRGREDERLDAAVPPPDGVGEVQQHARVALHRAADVAQQHERPRRACGGAGVGSLKTSPPVRTLLRERAPRSTRGPRPATQRRVRRSPGRPLEPLQRGARQRDLVGRELGEVLVRQRLRVAPRLQRARRRARRLASSSATPRLSQSAGAPVRWSSAARLVGRPLSRSGRPSPCSRQNASNARSNIARSSWRCTSSARHV